MWKCEVCNYIHNGDEAPHKCPKCGAAQEKFNELTGDAKTKVERSRYTNGLLKELILLMGQVQDIAQEGVEDELDPGCVKLFKEALEASEFLKQTATAEIEIHVGKGKWG